jgi:phospholipase C
LPLKVGRVSTVISQLARAFGVSDQWHASAPCQTWPNRFFAHTGTANGYVDNSPTHFPYEMETVFNRLADAGLSWRIYFNDFPQTTTLAKRSSGAACSPRGSRISPPISSQTPRPSTGLQLH